MKTDEMKMGQEYEDIITGFKGTCTGIVRYITGCNQVLLAPKTGKDGAKADAEWLRIEQEKQDELTRIDEEATNERRRIAEDAVAKADAEWLDVQRVRATAKKKVIKLANGKETGFDKAAPVR